MFFERVAIVGVGLIGGSFSLGIKEKKLCKQVVGAGRSAANLKAAMDLGVIDAVETDAAAAVRGADLVLVASPVAQFETIFLAIGPHLRPECLVMDAGSTKREVVELSLETLLRLRTQEKLAKALRGKVRWEGDLDDMRLDK